MFMQTLKTSMRQVNLMAARNKNKVIDIKESISKHIQDATIKKYLLADDQILNSISPK